MCRTFNVGIHAVSADGRTWSTPQVGYTLFAEWSNATAIPHPDLGRREAPQVLLSNDGKHTPVALFNAAMPCKCEYGNKNKFCNWGDRCRSYSMVCAFEQ
jgi:hypothetical protein